MGAMRMSALLGLLTLLITATANAHAPCSLATLNGRYVITSRSDLTTPVAVALVGLVDFDGHGHVRSVATLSQGGVTVANRTLIGTYTVNANCAFTQTVSDPAGALEHAAGVIADEGEHLLLIGTEPNAYATGDALRLERTTCESLPAATYAARGLMLFSPNGPETHVSTVSADAAGNLLITDSTTNLGAAVSSGGSGTAQLVVHPDCSVNMATTDGSSHYVGVVRITDGHIGLYLVGTDPGITVFYTALGTPRETP
jgi:hypothetical protein